MTKSKTQFPHGAALPVVTDSLESAEQIERTHADQSISHRQGVGNIRHEKGIQNTPFAGVSGSGPSAAAQLVRLRDVSGGSDQARCGVGGQEHRAQRPKHQSRLLGSYPYVGHDHEAVTLFRVWFSDHSAMLIDARDAEHAAEPGQAWSRHWDRLDPRRVVQVTKL